MRQNPVLIYKINYMKNIYTVVVLIVLIFFSCDKKESKEHIPTIDISKIYKNRNKVKLSEIANKIDYIQLETTEKSIIGVISDPKKKIKFFGNNIFVNSNGILRFNVNGKFLNSIGNLGRGPKEYERAGSFTLFKSEDSLVTIFSDVQQKGMTYNIEGDYKSSFKINFWPADLTSSDENLIFVNNIGSRNKSMYYSMNILSKKGELKKRLLFKENEKDIDLAGTSMYNAYFLNKKLHYWEDNYDTLWVFDENFKANPKYIFSIGENIIPLENRTQKNMFDFEYLVKFNHFSMLLESNRFFFFKTIFNKKFYYIYYDKLSLNSSALEFKRPFGKGKHLSFYNDIDGGIPFWPIGQVDDNKMFMLTYGYEIKDYIAKKGKDFDAIDKQSRDDLLKLVEKSKISDNPILMIVTLKK